MSTDTRRPRQRMMRRPRMAGAPGVRDRHSGLRAATSGLRRRQQNGRTPERAAASDRRGLIAGTITPSSVRALRPLYAVREPRTTVILSDAADVAP